MRRLKRIAGNSPSYDHLIGTGGIGTGIFFALQGDQTLGRNESRMATLLPYKDFCKQHIILHYVATLLGGNDFAIFPIGRIGNDEPGKQLLRMMEDAGMQTSAVNISEHLPTMYSVCFQYPDHSGGNITTDKSACSEVSPQDITSFFDQLPAGYQAGVVLAAPEVPLDARIALLHQGRKNNCLNISSVLSAEAASFAVKEGIQLTDILAVNLEEAKHLAQINGNINEPASIVHECISKLKQVNPSITILVTSGSQGVYFSNAQEEMVFTPALHMDVISTAGAGDAFLAGYITGICCGLPSSKSRSDKYFGETALESAVELGIIIASMSVTSADTIDTRIDASSIFGFIDSRAFSMHPDFHKIFESNEQA